MEQLIKSKIKSRNRIRKLIIAIEIIVLLFTTVFTWVYAKYGNMNISKLNLKKIDVNEIDEELYTGYTNIALFGLDNRGGQLDRGNSDTIIVVSINNETGKIKMASVYRDTYLSMGSSYSGYNKANAAYGNGGPEEALSMLNTNLDLNLTQYITTNWEALATAIDLIGGVDLKLEAEEVYWLNGYQLETAKSTGMMEDYDILPIKGGVQHLNGIQATSFCRIRYTQGDDYRRTERQRYVIQQIFEKSKTLSLKKLNKIANKIFPMISTNIKFSQLLRLGTRLMKFKFGATYGFPYTKSTGNAGARGSCVFCDDLVGDVARLHKDLFNEKDYKPSATVENLASVICKSAAQSSNESSSSSNDSSGYYEQSTDNSSYNDTSSDNSDYSYSDNTDTNYNYDDNQTGDYQEPTQ